MSIEQAIGPRVVGGTYRSGYWQQNYTVLSIDRVNKPWGRVMRVLWDDGRETEHSTSWDPKRDRVLEG